MSSDELIQISRQPPALRSQDYSFLRQESLEVIRALSPETWTDHNLHDPGITLLEAFCYGLTEAGLRVGMDVQDLIATSGARRDPEYFTAARVLPSSPVTPRDFRKLLIDHPDVANAWVFAGEAPPLGQISILLEFEEENLNRNTFAIQAAPPALAPSVYGVDLAFPHWDDEDVFPLREDVVLQAVVFNGAAGNEWNPIEGGQSYFSRITLTYQPPGGGASLDIQIWIVAQITTELENPVLETPLILAEATAAISTLVPPNLSVLGQLNQRITAAHEAMRTIRRFAQTHRNLCEDIVELNAVRAQEIALTGIIEVGDSVNIETLLAGIFLRLDQMISSTIVPRTLQRQLDDLQSADAVFDGPLLDHGFLSDDDLEAATSTNTLFVSDILRVIFQSRNPDETDVQRREDIGSRTIIAVRNLSLSNYLDNRLITTTAKGCLQLVNSRRHVPRFSVTKSHIVIYRNGIEVDYDKERVLELFQQGKGETSVEVDMGDNDLGLPPGQSYPFEDYYPIQNDLPRIYGVGESGLPENATAQRRAQALQLKGFLLLFEQMIAGYRSQLEYFNEFFSADPAIDRTLFQQPLYHLPGIASIMKAFDPQATTWQQFQEDESNAYATVLRRGVENREQFLARRNAVLDHLLAAIGESMKDRTALLLRLATEVQNGSFLSLPDLLAAQSSQRLEALQDLIDDKAQYYFDLPELNENKAQAFGNPLSRAAHLLRINATAGGYQWEIVDESEMPVLKHFEPPSPATVTLAASIQAARRDAEEAIKLGTNVDRYSVRLESGGQRRLEIRASTSAEPIAESVSTFNTDPLALAAIQNIASGILDLWMTYALAPIETRLYHLYGIDHKERRQLINTVSDYFEIFDEVDADPFIEKRFRLWEQPGFGGGILLASVDNYPGSTDADATAIARAAIQTAIDRGISSKSYIITETAPDSFDVTLTSSSGVPIAQSPVPLGTEQEARAEATRIQNHLFTLFSTQGFYSVEHHLLSPLSNAGVDLVISENTDPYSFQMTFVLPSGYARDFSNPNSDPPEIVQPILHSRGEFRKYAERQIREHCPAHILSRILWVDRALPGTSFSSTDPCFDAFEAAYRNWLRLYFTDEVDEGSLEPARNALTTSLNGLYVAYGDI